MWGSGAYALTSRGPDGAAALVEHDGRDALHLVDVTAEGFEETVVRRRTRAGVLTISSSRLHADAHGGLEWVRRRDRPGVTRTEVWSSPADGAGSWTRTDVRRDRTTSYRRTREGRIEGVATAPDGSELWRATWHLRGAGRLRGEYTDVTGSSLGTVERTTRDDTVTTRWTGPSGQGSHTMSHTMSGSAGPLPPRVQAEYTRADGAVVKISRQNEGDGHAVEVGSASEGRTPTEINSAREWIKIYVPNDGTNVIGPKDGGGSTVEFGTEHNPDGTTTDYTIGTRTKADGSSTSERTDHSSNGDQAESFGVTDVQGNNSVTDRTTHADGSWSLRTTTTDSTGRGTVHVTTGDRFGNVTSDNTTDIGPSAPAPTPTPGPDEPDPDEPDPDEPDPDEPDPDDDDPGDTDTPDPDPDPDTGMPVGDGGEGGDGGDVEGNPDGNIAGIDLDGLRHGLGGGWRGEDVGLDDLGDRRAQLGGWIEHLEDVIAAGGSVGPEGEELDNLGRPITGFHFHGGVAPDEELDDLGKPLLDIDLAPRPAPGGPTPGGESGGGRLGALVALSGQLTGAAVAVAASLNLAQHLDRG